MAYNYGGGGGNFLPNINFSSASQAGAGGLTHSFSVGAIRAAGQRAQNCRVGANDVALAHNNRGSRRTRKVANSSTNVSPISRKHS